MDRNEKLAVSIAAGAALGLALILKLSGTETPPVPDTPRIENLRFSVVEGD